MSCRPPAPGSNRPGSLAPPPLLFTFVAADALVTTLKTCGRKSESDPAPTPAAERASLLEVKAALLPVGLEIRSPATTRRASAVLGEHELLIGTQPSERSCFLLAEDALLCRSLLAHSSEYFESGILPYAKISQALPTKSTAQVQARCWDVSTAPYSVCETLREQRGNFNFCVHPMPLSPPEIWQAGDTSSGAAGASSLPQRGLKRPAPAELLPPPRLFRAPTALGHLVAQLPAPRGIFLPHGPRPSCGVSSAGGTEAARPRLRPILPFPGPTGPAAGFYRNLGER